MSLFSKKPKPVAPPPVLAAPPPVEQPKTETILKLNLPDVFAFHEDATKAKTKARPVPGAAEDLHSKTSRGSIVLVESDDEVRRLLSRLLQYEGFALRTATCLAEARTLVEELPADFVLARRTCVPPHLQTEIALREIRKHATVRVVDEFSELMLGQVVDYESLAQCTLALSGLLLSLHEGANPNVRGHAHTVTKYCRLVGQRLGLNRRDLDALTLAAGLHDLGALETTQRISEPTLQPNAFVAPSFQPTLDLLANVPFPYPIQEILAPEPATTPSLGARVLRVVDTYDTLRRTQAEQFTDDTLLFDWMRRQPTGTFDSDALETLIHIRKHERTISAMNLFLAAALLVDQHLDDLQLLKLRLENDDFQVTTARNVEDALHQLRTNRVSVVLTEYHLDRAGDGFDLLRAIKNDPDLRHIPVVFHALPNTDLIKQALELGAEDWYAKPHNIEIAAMKLQRVVGRTSAGNPAVTEGVHGNLRDMGLIEMVQILAAGGRSVELQVERENEKAELFLHQGQLLAAKCGAQNGDAAALEVLAWQDGSFRLRPLKEPLPANITTSTDHLLGERCRLDQVAKSAA
jgi:response regulator RpfG family c-di-GMP phosphodiesterase